VTAIIRIDSIVNRFGAQVVHDGVSLDVQQGEVFGIVGGSGSGKSVLLKTMLGLHRPNSGRVEVEGLDITTLDEARMRAVKQRYGVTFQQGALFSSLTVADNIVLPVREALDLDDDTLTRLVELRLRMVGLPLDSAAKYPAQLSGGMTKRAALARALALDPVLLFLDEPTAGLDPIAAAGFDELVLYLRNIREERKAILAVSEGWLLFRENQALTTHKDLLPFLTEGFTAAAMAKVGTSALESRKLGYLLDSDIVVPNKDELLFVAINEAKAMATGGYRPPLRRQFPVAGRSGNGFHPRVARRFLPSRRRRRSSGSACG